MRPGVVHNERYWMDIPDSLFVVASTFNLCVVLLAKRGSTTILPFYSEKNRTDKRVVIRHFLDLEHYIVASCIIFLLNYM